MATRSRRGIALALVLGLAVAACTTPTPSEPALTTAPATAAVSPSSAVSPPPSGAGPSASPEASDMPALPPLALEREIAVAGVFALAPAQDGGAWFVAPGSPGAVGLLGPAGVVRSADTGPVPFDVAAAGDSVYVLEGMPDTGGTGVPRTQCLERLDAATLAVEATVDLPHLAMEIVHTDGLVWTIGVRGTVTAHDDRDLAEVWSGKLDGGGPASIAATSDAVWAAIGNLDEGVVPHFVLGRIALGGDPVLAATEAREAVSGRCSRPIPTPGSPWPMIPCTTGSIASRPTVPSGCRSSSRRPRRWPARTAGSGGSAWMAESARSTKQPARERRNTPSRAPRVPPSRPRAGPPTSGSGTGSSCSRYRVRPRANESWADDRSVRPWWPDPGVPRHRYIGPVRPVARNHIGRYHRLRGRRSGARSPRRPNR